MTESTAELSTGLLRESQDALFVRLRELLRDRGIDVEASALATFFPDDVDLEFGVVVTADGRVYEFDLVYPRRGDIGQKTRNATLGDWRETTDWWRATPSHRDIEDAFQLLSRS